ncbi:TPA: hypothetical protein ACKPX5_000056 [Serratia marcescens]|uniref:hypothetical protein n=1 Tax=Serratia nevei TaxID=2703794 RepID=UPI0038BE830E
MDNKLSELSKPVDIRNWKMDSWREAPCNGTEWAKGYFEGWNKYHSKVEEHLPLYSQEYVSAMLAELEAKDKRIAELEEEFAFIMGQNDGMEKELREKDARIEHLEAKLATPVRLTDERTLWAGEDDYDTGHVKGWNANRLEQAALLKKQGFTVEGDE